MAKYLQPTYSPGTPKCDALFLTKRARANRDKVYKEGPIETIDGILSVDPRLLKTIDGVSREATDLNPETVDDQGRVSGNGVRSNFHGIRYVNAFGQLPATWPVVDNRNLREQSGLVNSFQEDWHRNVFRAIIKLFFEGLEPEPMRLRKGSSSMIPHYTRSMPDKIDLCKFVMANSSKIGELVLAKNWKDLFGLYFVGGAYHVVYRNQSSDRVLFDRATGQFEFKERKVADKEFALTGGRSGRYFASDRSLDSAEGYQIPKGFGRVRRRTAMGGPLGVNALLSPIAAPVRTSIYKKYPYSFHHTTRDQIQSDLNLLRHCVAVDVSLHDQFWPHFVLEEAAEVLREMGFASWWVDLYVIKSKLPVYVTDIGPDEGNTLVGDWLNPSLQVGLPSGNAFTDVEGTYFMTWVYLVAMVEHVMPGYIKMLDTEEGALNFASSFLKGELPITIKDKGDDALLGFKDDVPEASVLRFIKMLQNEERVSPYMNITYEHGGAFLGNLLLYPESKDIKKMVLVGDVNSWLVNQLSPEYSVQSQVRDRSRTRRPYPGLAWESYEAVYGSAPAYSSVKEIVEKHWQDNFGHSYRAFREYLLERDKARLAEYTRTHTNLPDPRELTAIDQDVLANPEKLLYRYSPDDVNPEIGDLLFQGVPLEFVEPYFKEVVPK